MALSPSGRIRINVTGARGGLGIDLQGAPTPGQFLVSAPGGGRKFQTASGTGADAGLREDLAAGDGAANIGFLADDQSIMETQQDINRRTVWAERYGLKESNSGAQNADAIEKAIGKLPPNGGCINIGHGTFVIDEILLPNDPKVVDIQGSGIGATRLVMGKPEGPLIRRKATTFEGGRITGARIGGFTIQAHADSDKFNLKHRAISFTGFGKSTFHDIAYKANGSGSVGCLFEAEGKTGPTYSNVIKRVEAMATIGPSRVLYLHNAGLGSLGNPNLTELRDSWIYACSGVDVIANVGDSTRTKIDNVLFEDCPGATGVILGQCTIVTACWFELIATNIATAAGNSVDGSSSIVMGNYFSGTGTSFIDTINVKPLWIGNSGGGQTVTGQGVTRIEGGYGSAGGLEPSPPTLARTDGVTTASFTEINRHTDIPMDAIGRVTFMLRYQVAASAKGRMLVTMTIPAGYTLEQWDLGCIRGDNGYPSIVGLTTDPLTKVVLFEGVDVHEMAARVTLKRN